MPKFLSDFLKLIYLGACTIFIIWGLQKFLTAGSIYVLYGWSYLMLGTISPAVVLLRHSERRKKGHYLSERVMVWLEAVVLIGIIVLISGLTLPVGFIAQLILSLIGFVMAVPSSFVYLYLSPPKSKSSSNNS